MKLRESKRDIWGGSQQYYGRYKHFKVEVTQYGKNQWYVLIDSIKHNITFNSLWEESKFESLEEATKYAVDWIDNLTRGAAH